MVQMLDDLHEERSHRDIKPHNIMAVWGDGGVALRLIDFANSRLHTEGRQSDPPSCLYIGKCIAGTVVDMSACLSTQAPTSILLLLLSC